MRLPAKAGTLKEGRIQDQNRENHTLCSGNKQPVNTKKCVEKKEQEVYTRLQNGKFELNKLTSYTGKTAQKCTLADG